MSLIVEQQFNQAFEGPRYNFFINGLIDFAYGAGLITNRISMIIKPLLRNIPFTLATWGGVTIAFCCNVRGSGKLQPKVEWTPEGTAPAPVNQGRLLSPTVFAFGGDLRNHLNHWWQSLTDEQKLYYAILLANATVFLAWKIPKLQNFMFSYFCSNPFARAVCWPMVFSTFSHYSAIHFGLNMYVLHSFMNATAHGMGKEQFLGFYLSAGVMSSLASHMYKTIIRTPGVSLGASGAIMGVLAYFCTQHPDSLLQVAFVPGFTFTASSGLTALLCLDTVGMFMRWKVFDHAAHLGGALFGMFWYYWGQKNIWGERVGLVQRWHDFRTGTRAQG
nr:EOG090X07NR [Moina brachiata]